MKDETGFFVGFMKKKKKTWERSEWKRRKKNVWKGLKWSSPHYLPWIPNKYDVTVQYCCAFESRPLYKGGIEQNQPTKQAVSAERKNGIQFHRENVHCIVSADLKYNKTMNSEENPHTHICTYLIASFFSLYTQQHLLCQPPHASNNTDAPRFFSPFPSHSLLFSLLSFNRFNCQHDYPGMIIIILCVCVSSPVLVSIANGFQTIDSSNNPFEWMWKWRNIRFAYHR